MAVAYYDNQEPLEDPVTADVDRVYRLDWLRFGDREWSALDQIYRNLPGWQGYLDVPYWFGTDDNDIPHLCISVEPSGLHVCGVLPASDWHAWVSQFESDISDFRPFECD